MANPWFKFYGMEFLADAKSMQLTGEERSCWLTILCYASATKDGVITYLTEDQVLKTSNVSNTQKIFEKFEEMGMIKIGNGNVTVLNWTKRQYSEAINRVRDHRLKRSGNGNVTTEKNRVEKSREEKREDSSPIFLENIPSQILQELSEKYKISRKGIQSKAIDLKLYCESNGRKYKNYKSFLENAIRKDQIKLRAEYPPPKQIFKPPPDEKITEGERLENMQAMEEARKNLNKKFNLNLK